MSKTNDELKQEIEKFGFFADFGGWLVVLGVLMEAAFSLLKLPEVVPDMIVAGGVAAEILFARKASASAADLQGRSNILIAEANERAAKAQLELERLKAPRGLTESQADAVIAKLVPFQGLKALVIASPSTYEGAIFADQINRVLSAASLDSKRLDRWMPTRGSIIAQDVFVTFTEGDTKSEELARAILEVFVSFGIKTDSKATSPDWWPAIQGHALVVVGDKT